MKKINHIIAISSLSLLFLFKATLAEPPKNIMDYYNQWIGCKAPKLIFIECDRIKYMDQSPKHKKILLYSFDSGDFVNEPKEEQLLAELFSLKKALSQASESILVIGFTYGAMFSPCFEGATIPNNIERLTRFPIINLNSRDNAPLEEPYALLKRCGAIVIDKNGVITNIIPHSLSEADFMQVINAPPWQGKIKPPPVNKERSTLNESKL